MKKGLIFSSRYSCRKLEFGLCDDGLLCAIQLDLLNWIDGVPECNLRRLVTGSICDERARADVELDLAPLDMSDVLLFFFV